MFHGGNVETSYCGALKFLGKTFGDNIGGVHFISKTITVFFLFWRVFFLSLPLLVGHFFYPLRSPWLSSPC